MRRMRHNILEIRFAGSSNLVPRVVVLYCACSRPLIKGNEDARYEGGVPLVARNNMKLNIYQTNRNLEIAGNEFSSKM